MTAIQPLLQPILAKAASKVGDEKRRAVIVGGDSDAVLSSLQTAHWIHPIIIGDGAAIERRARALGLSDLEIVAAEGEEAMAECAVRLSDSADIIVKGQIHTDTFMRALLGRAAGLRGDRMCSHIFYLLSEDFPHAYYISDAALNLSATGAVGEAILSNLAEFMEKIEGDVGRIAILSASEVVNPKMASSVEAVRLVEWAKAHLPRRTAEHIAGPMAMDVALSKDAARIKGLSGEVMGCANGLLVPSIEAGNILFKSWVHFNNAVAAGIVVGARLPIVLTSRSDSAESRLVSLALACIA